MKTFLSIVISILFCITTNLKAQDTLGFNKFLTEFRIAVKKGDKAAVAGMCDFPMYSFDMVSSYSKKKKIETISSEVSREDFLKYYSLIFTSERKKQIMKNSSAKSDLYGDDDLIFILVWQRSETSTCWLNFHYDGMKWHLVGGDNISK